MTEGAPKEKEISLREKAELAMDWAATHVAYPCGDTPEQKEYMREIHITAVRSALSEPGVRGTLSEVEEILLQFLGVDEDKKEKDV